MRWLRLQGRHADVVTILKKAARVNGKTLPEGLELETLPKTSVTANRGSVLDLFRPLKMLSFSSVQGFAWYAALIIYDNVHLSNLAFRFNLSELSRRKLAFI